MEETSYIKYLAEIIKTFHYVLEQGTNPSAQAKAFAAAIEIMKKDSDEFIEKVRVDHDLEYSRQAQLLINLLMADLTKNGIIVTTIKTR